MKDQKLEDAMEVGTWLGRRQAFSIVAGRCSAADAQCLRELRESKKYKSMGLTWEECCKQRAGIHRSSAEAIIRNLEEFGPDYFVIAQVTGIPAKEYRLIQGSVRNHALLHAGEEIPVAVENAPRLIEAVDALRRGAAEAPAPPGDIAADAARRFAKAGKAMQTALAELDELRLMRLDIGGRMRLQSAIGEAAGKLRMLDMQVKV
ncbi:MAG TPA: hypothetical protein VNY05_02840 [Candidatus Acidoferrales bacterium]|jgi:hypothetical protein|nr:hypothetical protein [Candidatus Acidoferrales bacterium]